MFNTSSLSYLGCAGVIPLYNTQSLTHLPVPPIAPGHWPIVIFRRDVVEAALFHRQQPAVRDVPRVRPEGLGGCIHLGLLYDAGCWPLSYKLQPKIIPESREKIKLQNNIYIAGALDVRTFSSHHGILLVLVSRRLLTNLLSFTVLLWRMKDFMPQWSVRYLQLARVRQLKL